MFKFRNAFNLWIKSNSTIKYFNDYGFYNCSKLEILKEIGNYSFYKCINLIDISIEKLSKLTIIGSYSFSYCINLTSITLPLQLKEISSNLFEGCSKLESIFQKLKILDF